MLTTERAFAIKIGLGLAVGGWLIFWSAIRHNTRPSPWLDTYLAALFGGVVGARLGYVLLHIEDFRHQLLNIPRLWYGELSWIGAIIGGGLVVWMAGHWRKSALENFNDALALALPVGFMAVCWAARSAGLILGQPVSRLEDVPVWSASFLPDLYRDVSPRYELQMLGVGMGAIMLMIIGWLTWGDWLKRCRLGVALGLMGMSILVLDFYSAGQGQILYEVRVNEIGGGVLALVGLGMIVAELSVNRMIHAVPPQLKDQL